MRTTLAFLVCVTACFLYSAFLGHNVMARKLYPEENTQKVRSAVPYLKLRENDKEKVVLARAPQPRQTESRPEEGQANAHIAILEDLLIPGTKWENDEVFDQQNLQHVRSAVPYLKIRENGQENDPQARSALKTDKSEGAAMW